LIWTLFAPEPRNTPALSFFNARRDTNGGGERREICLEIRLWP
jgi:hypothetical protein